MPHSVYLPERMGSAVISPTDPVEAGSFRSFTLVYTAGYFGIDDTGSIKIVHRFASDMGRPQWSDPQAPNYTTVEASNGAVLEVQLRRQAQHQAVGQDAVHPRASAASCARVTRSPCASATRGKARPACACRPSCEPTFEFRVLADPFAMYNFVELPVQPFIPDRRRAAGAAGRRSCPRCAAAARRFASASRARTTWGNPSDQVEGVFMLRHLAGRGSPPQIDMRRGKHAIRVDGLIVEQAGDLLIERAGRGWARCSCTSNPLRLVAEAELLPYWCDLHGQSEETIGTNSARELIEFARDRAFLDGMSHQGNDFQITTPFWNELNALTREYNEDGRFIIFPGYEWSGNTGLGGDRNVMFMQEGRQIHRSSMRWSTIWPTWPPMPTAPTTCSRRCKTRIAW